MSCEICGRGACTRTFHSIAEQEAFDSEAGAAERALFDKIADLELTCRAQTGAIAALRAAHEALLRRTQSLETALDQERADNERLRAFAQWTLDRIPDAVCDEMHRHGLVDINGGPTALLSGRGEKESPH